MVYKLEISRSGYRLVQLSGSYEIKKGRCIFQKHIQKLKIVPYVSVERDPGILDFKCRLGKPMGKMKAAA